MEVWSVSMAVVWFILGILFLFAEMAVPGFIIFFFGLGAMAAAAVAWLVPGASLALQIAVFAVASVATLVLSRVIFRDFFRGRTVREKEDADDDGLVGATGVLSQAIEPPVAGRVEVHGSDWKAVSNRPISAGTAVRVTARDNITLTVEPAD